MGYVHDGDPGFAQPLDLREQQVHLAGGQHRCWLVEHQYTAVADQIAGDFDHLLMADAQGGDRRIRVYRFQPDLRHGLSRHLAQTTTGNPAATAGQIVEKQVLGHGQCRQQVEFLQHHAHTKAFSLASAGRGIGLAEKTQGAGGGLLQSAEDLRQRALAGAVLTGQRQHLAGAQLQVDAAQHRLGVGLADSAGGENGLAGHYRCGHGLVTSSTGVSMTPSLASVVSPLTSLSAASIPNTACCAANWSAVASTRPSLSIGLMALILS